MFLVVRWAAAQTTVFKIFNTHSFKNLHTHTRTTHEKHRALTKRVPSVFTRARAVNCCRRAKSSINNYNSVVLVLLPILLPLLLRQLAARAPPTTTILEINHHVRRDIEAPEPRCACGRRRRCNVPSRPCLPQFPCCTGAAVAGTITMLNSPDAGGASSI